MNNADWIECKKVSIAKTLLREADQSGWSQKHIMDVTGLYQAEVSELLNMKLRRFSLERLLSIMLDLGYDVTIEIKPV